jgi:hypothetical protein
MIEGNPASQTTAQRLVSPAAQLIPGGVRGYRRSLKGRATHIRPQIAGYKVPLVIVGIVFWHVSPPVQISVQGFLVKQGILLGASGFR